MQTEAIQICKCGCHKLGLGQTNGECCDCHLARTPVESARRHVEWCKVCDGYRQEGHLHIVPPKSEQCSGVASDNTESLKQKYEQMKQHLEASQFSPLGVAIENIKNSITTLKSFYADYGQRLKAIEDMFEGKSFKPIHDAMETYIDHFNERLALLEDHDEDRDQFEREVGERLDLMKNNLNSLGEFLGGKTVDYEGRIGGLESQIKQINGQKFSEFHYLTPRIEKLERLADTINAHQHGAEDLVKKLTEILTRKFNGLETLVMGFENNFAAIPQICERLEHLESYMEMEDRVTASDVLLRLTELETNVEGSRTFQPIASGKVPHKCPVCDGKCNRPDEGIGACLMKNQPCYSCEGKGIVWG